MKIGQLLRIQTFRRRQGQLVLFVAVGSSLTILAAAHFINSPATGIIFDPKAPAPQNGTSVLAFTESKRQYNGKYINFSYPSDYRPTYSSAGSNYLEVCQIYSPNHSNRFISVSVIRESVENDSGVYLRQNHPEIYEKQSAPAGSQIFLSRQNGFERTVFSSHNDLVITIAAVDAAGNDITSDQQQVIDSLKWE